MRQKGGLTPRALTLRIWVVVWLVLVWNLLWGNVSAANVISGLAIALVVTVLLPLPPVPVEGRVHLLSTLRLIAVVSWNLAWSSAQIAWLAVRPGPPPLPAVLRAHLDIKSDLVLALGVNIINLIPGTIVLEIDQVRRIIYVHVIDISTERAVAQFHRQVNQLERLLVAAFERDSEWQPAREVPGE